VVSADQNAAAVANTIQQYATPFLAVSCVVLRSTNRVLPRPSIAMNAKLTRLSAFNGEFTGSISRNGPQNAKINRMVQAIRKNMSNKEMMILAFRAI
jgi:hypothetical protein